MGSTDPQIANTRRTRSRALAAIALPHDGWNVKQRPVETSGWPSNGVCSTSWAFRHSSYIRPIARLIESGWPLKAKYNTISKQKKTKTKDKQTKQNGKPNSSLLG